LIFFDIIQDGHKIQVMCNKRQLEDVSPEQFKKLYRLLRRGDAFCMTAHFPRKLWA
jgi:lysyl-tRNA synthetase class 2